MKNICIGKYVNTHGIKGEIKLISNFKYKEKVFKTGEKVYIKDKEFIINSYRKHQKYDMLTFKNINNINDIIDLKGSLVYINESDLKLDNGEYLDTDLIGYLVYMNDLKGEVQDIKYLINNKKLLVVRGCYVPFELIKEIDFKNKKIIIEEIEGLL